MSVTVDVKELLAAGAHFGHKTSRWHPKMAPYIHSKRGGSHIIDLIVTGEMLETALAEVVKETAKGKQVLFVGTKKQVADSIKAIAETAGMPFVTERWLGGMLTNQKTMNARIKHLKKLEERMDSGELGQRFNKLEVQRFQEEIDRLNTIFGGVKEMHGLPGLVFVTDIINDAIAVKEAQKLGIPVIGISDTNADPTTVEFAIPCNDDAIKAVNLVSNYIASAVKVGQAKQKAPAKDASAKPPAVAAKAPATSEKSDKKG